MSNTIHTLLAGRSKSVYAIGSEKCFLLVDSQQLKLAESYGGGATYGDGTVYGDSTQQPLPIWHVGAPVLQTARTIGVDNEVYQLRARNYHRNESQTLWVHAVSTSQVLVSSSYISNVLFTLTLNQWIHVTDGVELLITQPMEVGSVWKIVIQPWAVRSRITGFMYDGQYFLAGRGLELHRLFGRTANPHAAMTADYVFELSNHACLLRDNLLSWSNAFDFSQFTPATHRTADFYIFSRESEPACGCEEFGTDHLIIYPERAYLVRYVGKPGVMDVKRLATGLGGVLRGSVSQHAGIFYYATTEGLWMFDGQQRQNISAKVWAEVVEQADKTKLDKIWSYVSKITNEIVWVFMSYDGGGVYDRAIAYNHLEKTWAFFDVPNSTAYLEPLFTIEKKNILSLKGMTIGELSGPISELGSVYEPVPMFGVVDAVWTTMVDGDDSSLAVDTITAAFLESPDIYYGDLHYQKDVDMIFIDADYDDDCLGIDVYVSARQYRSQAVEWQLVGRWSKEAWERHIDFGSIDGRVFRFKFQPVGATNGLKRFEFFAWGERVDLPTPEGPEK